MAYTPADPFPKTRGDAIRSQDWNEAVLELQRLDDAKINKAGDAITGSLTVSGNVGVGTSNPGAKLHVAGGGSIRWGNNSELVADQGGSIELGGNNSTAGTGLPYIDFHFSGLTQDFNTRITNDANGRLSLIASTLQATGNVGVGTPSPQRALSVNAALNVDQANANSGAVNPGITFGSSSGEGIASKRTAGGNQAGLDLYTNNAARLSITNSGNVGIGTAAPGARLDISGSGGAAQCCAPDAHPPTLSLAEASSSANRQAWLQLHNGGEAEAYIRLAGVGPSGSGRAGQQRLEIGANRGGTAGLTVTGNVGIRTTDPQRPLQVGADVSGVGLAPSEASPNAGYVRWGDNTGWKLHFGRSRESSGGALNTGTTGVLLTMQDNGRVGIGTVTPRTTLEVRGSLTLEEGGSPVLFTGTGTSELNRYLLLANSPDSTSASGLKVGGVLVSDTYTYANPSKNELIVKGNIGVGTTSPAAKLQVSGGAIMPTVGNSATAGIQFPANPGGGSGDEAFIRYFVESGETTKLLIGCQNDADDRISLYQFGGERLTVYNGLVGIGTTNPQYGRLMIEDASVPLSLRESGQAANAGGLWRMPLDAGILRFDVNTAAAGDFSSYATPLAMTAAGNVGVGGWPSANQRLLVQITGAGPDEVRGMQAQASGTGPGNKFGVYGQATGAGEKLAGYFDADSAGGEPTRGVFGRATGAGTGSKYGAHGIVMGGGEKYGGFFEAQGGDDSWTNAVQGNAYGAGAGPKYGIYGSATGAGEKQAGYFYADSAGNEPTGGTYSHASGAGTGDKYGIRSYAIGGGQKFGGYFVASSAGNDFTNAVYGQAYGNGTGETHAVYGRAYGDGTGTKYGVRGTAIGGGQKFGGHFESSTYAGSLWTWGTISYAYSNRAAANAAPPTGPTHAVYGQAYGDGTGTKFGVRGYASGGGEKYGGYFDAGSAGTELTYGSYSQAYGDGTGTKYGVRGYAGGGGWKYGGYFDAWSAGTEGTYGVYSQASGSGTGTKYGIYSYAGGGGTTFAGYFAGDVYVSGSFRVGGTVKQFVIDHPLDPENKTLSHTSVESPEILCLYRGKVRIGRSGRKMVRMPDYFAALTKEDEATVYLTPVGKEPSPASYQWDETYTKLTVFGTAGAEVAYLVLAARDDPAVHLRSQPVEEEKGNGNFEKGKLLTPEAFDQPAEMGVAALPPQADAGQPEVAVPEPVPAEPAAPEPAREEPPPPEPIQPEPIQPEPVQPTRPEPVAPEAPARAQGGDEQGDRESSDVDATKAAERKARELGVRLSEVKGTGSGGRILVKDIERAAKD